MAKLDTLELVYEMRILLGKETAEAIEELLDEPLAEFNPYELARIANAFTQIGKQLTENAKKEAIETLGNRGADTFAGVTMEYKKGGTQRRLNTTVIRAKFPYEKFPKLYKISPVKESVAVTIESRAYTE